MNPRFLSALFSVQLCLIASACSNSDGGSAPTIQAAGGSRATGGAKADAGEVVGNAGGASSVTGEAGRAGTFTTSGGASPMGSAGAVNSSADGGTNAVGTAGSPSPGGNNQAGTTSAVPPCTVPPPAPSELLGWASVTGNNVPITTGGGDASPLVVTNFGALSAAASGSKASVIHIQGNITGSVSVGSNKTLVGICGGSITGHVHLSGSSNVIVRNLKILGNNCNDSPTDCSNGADAVSIINSAHHIWFDHCDVSDGSDGNLDITNGSDFVTISYTKFSYSSRRTDPVNPPNPPDPTVVVSLSGHRFSNLIGAADDVALDVGRLNVTFHHNWWADNIDQRMPRTRRGKIHLFNNLYTSIGNSYCTNAGFEAAVRVENNIYAGVNKPLAPDANSFGLESIDNVFIGTTGNAVGLRSSFVPPYQYVLDATGDLQSKLQAEVGPK